jgi:hypothetical protein
MSDRTQSSVRTGSRSGDPAAPTGDTSGDSPASTTQAIPGTGTQRAQAATAGIGPSGPPPVPPSVGTPTGGLPAGGPAAATGIGGLTGTGTPAVPIGSVPAGAGPAATVGPRTGRGRGPGRAGGRGPRRARLQLRHVDTWSALKISLVLSIALFFIWMVAVGILYMVLNGLGVFNTLNDLFGQVGSVSGSKASSPVITPGVVFGGAAIIGAINIVLMTALCTVGTFIYNMCSDLVGGLEITLSERD